MHRVHIEAFDDAEEATNRLAALLEPDTLRAATGNFPGTAPDDSITLIIELGDASVTTVRRDDTEAALEGLVGVPSHGSGEQTPDEFATHVADGVSSAVADLDRAAEWVNRIGGAEVVDAFTRSWYDSRAGGVEFRATVRCGR